uniref:Large ribosomal subunit protein uL4c n=1 Tax=Caloglossa beccarii TaxID=131038 RepID=A0A1Z1M8N0_9FLOR|nr:ribosomal protein L4 [Caloglossa beccarii]ARW62320.1 ribosomal protein L4 [Caloglossa beccarii]
MEKKYFSFNFNKNQEEQMYIVHRAITHHLNSSRQRSANTKTRSEVKGGGKKPWKQKGTGKARAGSIRSPLWKGGGIIFGPKYKDYITKINKKEKKLATKILIYNKQNNTIIINTITDEINKPNTKYFIKQLKNFNIQINDHNIKLLIIIENYHKNLYLSIRNLPNVELTTANNINILSLIKAHKIITTHHALKIINQKYKD